MSDFKDFYSEKTRIKRLPLSADTRIIVMSDMHRGRPEVRGPMSDVRCRMCGEKTDVRGLGTDVTCPRSEF